MEKEVPQRLQWVKLYESQDLPILFVVVVGYLAFSYAAKFKNA